MPPDPKVGTALGLGAKFSTRRRSRPRDDPRIASAGHDQDRACEQPECSVPHGVPNERPAATRHHLLGRWAVTGAVIGLLAGIMLASHDLITSGAITGAVLMGSLGAGIGTLTGAFQLLHHERQPNQFTPGPRR